MKTFSRSFSIVGDSLSAKFTIFVLGTITVSFVVTAIGAISYYHSRTENYYVSEIDTLSNVISSNSSAAIAFRNPDSLNEFLKSLSSYNDIQRICIFDANKAIFAEYSRPPSPKCDAQDGTNQNQAGDAIIVTKIITQSSTILGTAKVYANKYSYETYTLSALALAFIMFPVFALLILLPLAIYLRKNISSPISTALALSRSIAGDVKPEDHNDIQQLIAYMKSITHYVATIRNDSADLLRRNLSLQKNLNVSLSILSDTSRASHISTLIGVEMLKSKDVKNLGQAVELFEVSNKLTGKLETRLGFINKALLSKSLSPQTPQEVLSIEELFISTATRIFNNFEYQNITFDCPSPSFTKIHKEQMENFFFCVFLLFEEFFYNKTSSYEISILPGLIASHSIRNCSEFTIIIKDLTNSNGFKERFSSLYEEEDPLEITSSDAEQLSEERMHNIVIQMALYANMNYSGADEAASMSFANNRFSVKFKVDGSQWTENKVT